MSVEMKIPKDLRKINVNELGELIWWSNHLGITPEDLWSALNKVGASTEQVRKYLADKAAAAP